MSDVIKTDKSLCACALAGGGQQASPNVDSIWEDGVVGQAPVNKKKKKK